MNIYLKNEYDKIMYYLIVYPCKFYVDDGGKNLVKRDLLFHQYNNFVNLLTNLGIKVQFLDLTNSAEQVYTRDIGFVVRDIFFVSKLKSPERQSETEPLMNFIKTYNLKHYVMQNPIEGGDVVIRDEVLFIGASDRTSLEAIKEVQQVLNENNVDIKAVPVAFDRSKIHLDCVFNTLDRDNCLVTDYLYDTEIIQKYIKNCIKLDKTAADELGTNYVYLGERKLITNSKSTCTLLKEIGFDPYYTDFSEIIKGSGSLGCSTLPILRH
jgi:N-dimethylarginine dimethylaminohydrolase